jgi:RND superfamily putative drug exporter
MAMTRALYRLAGWSYDRRRRVLAAWLVAVVAALAGAAGFAGKLVDDYAVPGSESAQVTDRLSRGFPAAAGDLGIVVVSVPEGRTVRDPALAAAIGETVERARRLDHVTSVTDPRQPQGSFAVSRDGRVAYISVQYDVAATTVGKDGADALAATADPVRAAGARAVVGGPVGDQAKPKAAPTSEAFGILAATVILLVALRSAVAMAIPIVTALLGLGTSLALVVMAAQGVTISTVAPALGSMIGLGVGIDYALVIIARHQETLRRTGGDIRESAARAVATAGGAVVFAGVVVVLAIAGLFLTGVPFIGSMGVAAATAVTLSVLLAVTLLPALLGFAGDRITRFGLSSGRRDRGTPLGERWAGEVTRRPWRYGIGVLAAGAVLSVPAFSMDIGFPDASNDPASSDTRQAYDLLTDAFGPGTNGPLIVAATLPAGDDAGRRYLADLQQSLRATGGVAQVVPPQVGADGRTAVLTVIPTTAPEDQATTDLATTLREDVLPASDRRAGPGASALLGGATAGIIDLNTQLTEALPLFIGVVIGLSFLLLMAVFRSVLIPLKSAVLNLLSVGVAYGVVVAVFQWGWGEQLVGLDKTLPVPSFMPVFLFAILFGLSMDYEVFLVSRIREEFLAGGDARAAVREGLARTSRVIVSAGLIMVSVFAAFVGTDDWILKVFGVGLAAAIAFDALLLRLVLVPAVMTVLGRHAWWLPAWLDRALPRIDVEGESALPPLTPRPGVAPVLEPAGSADHR